MNKNVLFKILLAASVAGTVTFLYMEPSSQSMKAFRDGDRFASISAKADICEEKGLVADMRTGACTEIQVPDLYRVRR